MRQWQLKEKFRYKMQDGHDVSTFVHFLGIVHPPKRYTNDHFPRLGRPDCDDCLANRPCPHCLCTPCVVSKLTSFLTGSGMPALDNMTKWFALYMKFWQLLKKVRLWQCQTCIYLQRKNR